MSEKTLTPLQKIIVDKLRAYPNKSPKELAQEINEDPENIRNKNTTSAQYVYKMRARAEKEPKLFETPSIQVEPPEEPEEPEEEPEPEEPFEFEKEPEEEPIPQMEEPSPEDLAEEQKKYQPIFLRSFARLQEVLLDYGDVDTKGDSKENEDTMILAFGLVSKYSGFALEKYYLESASIMHFGTIIMRTILKRRQKKKLEEAKDVTPKKEPEPMKTEDKPEPEKPSEDHSKTEKPPYMEKLQ